MNKRTVRCGVLILLILVVLLVLPVPAEPVTWTVLFIGPLLALVGLPPFVEDECFRVSGAGPNDGVYLAERIVPIPDGAYPPTDGSPGCPGTPEGAVSVPFHLAKNGPWYHYAVCATPRPAVHAGSNDVTLEVIACPGREDVFADGFESGDISRWSSADGIFSDGFESGSTDAWDGRSP